MSTSSATAVAHPNIAFIKYWGNRDHDLRLPANSSLSLTLEGLETRTTVQFDSELAVDRCWIDGRQVEGEPLARVSAQLTRIRSMAGLEAAAAVRSRSNFPMGAGVASSASAFAALTLAGCRAAGVAIDERELSRLARCGSGSAARSIFGGYVLWHLGDDEASFAEPLAPPEHWPLTDLIVVVDRSEKPLGSRQGHRLADSSPLQPARVSSAPDRLEQCRQAILNLDFDQLAWIAELDSDLLHAVMMTSQPPLLYWLPETVRVIRRVRALRDRGLPVFYTIDAGPNVHCICPIESVDEVRPELATLPGVLEILEATPGGPAHLTADEVDD